MVTLIAMRLVTLRRTRRGEKAFIDEHWRFLVGKPKAEVLTAPLDPLFERSWL
jgi:hypothetical protein